jgi:hypothetical protein
LGRFGHVDNCHFSVDNSLEKPVDNLWGEMAFRLTLVENFAISVDNPAGTVHKTGPSRWKSWGEMRPNRWITCL